MDLTVFSEQNFLIFILPGFITVWTFRYFTNSKKSGDLEFLILSFIWGFLILLFNEWTSAKVELDKLLQNPYAVALTFGISGFVFGLFGAQVVQWKWFRNMTNWLKSSWLF